MYHLAKANFYFYAKGELITTSLFFPSHAKEFP